MSNLTNKQKAFIEEYLKDFNGTRAAKRAGYQGNDNVLAQVAWANIRNPKIEQIIKFRLDCKAMRADEALQLLAEHARYDIGPYLDINGNVDIAGLKEAGLTHLIRSITPTQRGTKIEFVDKQNALFMILRAQGAFRENLDITSGGSAILVLGGVNLDKDI